MSYWDQIAAKRIDRRRVLLGTAAVAGASTLLLACGSDSKSKNDNSDKSGLLTKPVDTDNIGKRGGTYKFFSTSDVPRGFDPYLRELTIAVHNQRAYQTLLRVKPGVLEPADIDVFEPAVAESWEFSPDKTQLTFKIRPDAKLDPRPPTSGRALNADDIAFTWKRYSEVATLRSDVANAVNPDAPVISVSTTDARTVVFKLAYPAADLLGTLSPGAAGNFLILPKDADGGFDVRREQRGSGPWYLSDYVPSARFVYSRNPGYWDKKFPFVDPWEMPIVSEYSQALAQFKNGNIYSFDPRQEDIVQTKRDVMDLQMIQNEAAGQTTTTIFGWKEGPKSPFRDERVRQAYSMAQDRDLFIDTFNNVSKFQAQGLPIEAYWNNPALRIDFPAWWLDPKRKDYGPNGKYLQHDIAEAKKLLAAAGYANGLDVDAHYITSNEFGEDFPKRIEVLLAMVADAGIRAKLSPVDYATELRPKYIDAKGNFEGVAYRRASATTPRSSFFAIYNKNGSQFNGFSAQGTATFGGDPEIDALTAKILREFDAKAAIALGYELQRLEAKNQYTPQFPGGATGFTMAWPVVGNFGVHHGDTIGTTGASLGYFHAWIDDTKPPLKRA